MVVGGEKKGDKILLNEAYKHINHESAVKLMLRIVKLYTALTELKKILQFTIKQEDIFTDDGLVYGCLNKYNGTPNPQISPPDQSVIMRGFQVLKQLARHISHFLQENKMYKSFVFDDKDHAQVLANHNDKILRILKKMKVDNLDNYKE